MSKWLSVFWGLTALVLWAFITSKDVNLLVSLFIAVWFITYLLHHLNGGALHGMRRVLRGHWTVSICLGTGLVTSVMFTSIIAGDWSPEHKIPSVCMGPLHIHHWAKGLALCAWHARLCSYLFRRRWELVHHYGTHSLQFAIGLVCLSGLCYLTGYGNASLQAGLAIISAYILMLGMLCRTDEVSTLWFKRYLALSLGIAMGITMSGGIEVLRDFVIGGRIPNTFIFWNTQPDSSCH